MSNFENSVSWKRV